MILKQWNNRNSFQQTLFCCKYLEGLTASFSSNNIKRWSWCFFPIYSRFWVESVACLGFTDEVWGSCRCGPDACEGGHAHLVTRGQQAARSQNVEESAWAGNTHTKKVLLWLVLIQRGPKNVYTLQRTKHPFKIFVGTSSVELQKCL